jgi:hypothetical protein
VGKSIRLILALFAGMIFLGACQSGPLRRFEVGDELAAYSFSEPGGFEEGVYAGVTLRLRDGVYRISLDRGDNELWWGQWGETLSDVVIDVEAEQISERPENAFGIGCRMAGTTGQTLAFDPTMAAIANSESPTEATAEPTSEATESADVTDEATDEPTEEATEAVTEEPTDEPTEEATEAVTEEPTAEATESSEEDAATEEPRSALSGEAANGDGYLFLIQGTGSFAIMRSRGRDITPLVNWTPSDKIHAGMERNQLRAVCLGDYLAFYINGEFVGDTTDSTFESGQVALLASAATRLGAVIEFDDLKVSEALPD